MRDKQQDQTREPTRLDEPLSLDRVKACVAAFEGVPTQTVKEVAAQKATKEAKKAA